MIDYEEDYKYEISEYLEQASEADLGNIVYAILDALEEDR